MKSALSRRVYLEREPALPLHFEVVQLRPIRTSPDQPTLKRIRIPNLVYAIFLRVLYNLCYDMRWDRLSRKILVHKFNLFPDRRRWQIEKWVAQFRRQNLFPNASESELQDHAKELVMAYLI
jgi:hypothetical protein